MTILRTEQLCSPLFLSFCAHKANKDQNVLEQSRSCCCCCLFSLNLAVMWGRRLMAPVCGVLWFLTESIRDLQGGFHNWHPTTDFSLWLEMPQDSLAINYFYISSGLNLYYRSTWDWDVLANLPAPRTAALLKQNSAYNIICQLQWPGTFHSIKRYPFLLLLLFFIFSWEKQISKYPVFL